MFDGSPAVLWSTPLDNGTWHRVEMRVVWSTDPTIGAVELWYDGAPITFTGGPNTGQLVTKIQTLTPGGGGVYFKQGYYRTAAATETGVVFHDGYKVYSQDPHVSGAPSLTPERVAPVAVVRSATVVPGAVTLQPAAIATSSVARSATVSPRAVTVAAEHIVPSLAIHSPSLAAGAVTLTPTVVGTTGGLFAPSVTPGATEIAVGAIPAAGSIFDAQVTSEGVLTPARIASSAVVHDVVIEPGSVTLVADHIAATSGVFAAVVSGVAPVLTPGYVAATSTVHAPAITAGAVTVLVARILPMSVVYAAAVFDPEAVAVWPPSAGKPSHRSLRAGRPLPSQPVLSDRPRHDQVTSGPLEQSR